MAKILVVEDDNSMNNILVKTLRDQAHEVNAAFDVQEAIESCRNNQYDLVITDVRLPGKDGVEGLATIKELQENIQCIVITGYASAETPARAIKLRVDDYLLKPFKLQSFLTSVRRVLDPEGEGESRLQLLRNLIPHPQESENKEVTLLIAERKQALRGLYVGIRSGFLSHLAAREIYIKIEVLEDKFRKIVASPNPERMKLLKIRVLYAAISDRIVYFHSGNADEAPEETIALDTGHFLALYDGIRLSTIGLNDLDPAPLLRRMPNEKLEAHPELLELKRLMWPSFVTQ